MKFPASGFITRARDKTDFSFFGNISEAMKFILNITLYKMKGLKKIYKKLNLIFKKLSFDNTNGSEDIIGLQFLEFLSEGSYTICLILFNKL